MKACLYDYILFRPTFLYRNYVAIQNLHSLILILVCLFAEIKFIKTRSFRLQM